MIFDVTNLDRKILLKGLLAYAEPVGLGIEEYTIRKSRKENVNGLSDLECEQFLNEFESIESGNKRIVDYYRGQPIKYDLLKKSSGQILANSTAYDDRHGKFKFLEVLLDFFLVDEILITRKGYSQHSIFESESRDTKKFEKIVQKTIEKRGDFGRYWVLNTDGGSYNNPFTNLIK